MRNEIIPCKCEVFIRDEGKNKLIISRLGYDEGLILNPTGNEIYNLIDGKRCIGDIIQLLCNKYESIDCKVIEKDVKNILKSLFKQEIITFEGVSKMETGKVLYEKDNYRIRALNEFAFQEIVDFLKEQENSLLVINEMGIETYNEITIRTKLFNYSEEFFVLEKENRIVALISFIKYSSTIGNYFRNGLLKYDSNCLEDEITLLIDKASCYLMENNVYNAKKIRISYLYTRNFLGNILENAGYKSIMNDIDGLTGALFEACYDYKVKW